MFSLRTQLRDCLQMLNRQTLPLKDIFIVYSSGSSITISDDNIRVKTKRGDIVTVYRNEIGVNGVLTEMNAEEMEILTPSGDTVSIKQRNPPWPQYNIISNHWEDDRFSLPPSSASSASSTSSTTYESIAEPSVQTSFNSCYQSL
jgi:hypothetical protein